MADFSQQKGEENNRPQLSKRELSSDTGTSYASTKRRQYEEAHDGENITSIDLEKRNMGIDESGGHGGSDCTKDLSEKDSYNGGDENIDANWWPAWSGNYEDISWESMQWRSPPKLDEGGDSKEKIPSGGDQSDQEKDYTNKLINDEENDANEDQSYTVSSEESISNGNRDDGLDESELFRLSKIICVKKDGGHGGNDCNKDLSEEDRNGSDENIYAKSDLVEKLNDDGVWEVVYYKQSDAKGSSSRPNEGDGDQEKDYANKLISAEENDTDDDQRDKDSNEECKSSGNTDGIQKEYGVGVIYPKINPFPSALRELVQSCFNGMPREPSITYGGGESKSYFIYGNLDDRLAVFKPRDGEAKGSGTVPGGGIKRGTIRGEGYIREAAAYLLDHPQTGPRGTSRVCPTGFCRVPPTCVVNIWGPMCVDNISGIGSLQKFIPNVGSCEVDNVISDRFSVREVHRIAILDLRFANADRHLGNILRVSQEDGPCLLIPIDHGYCFPSSFQDCTFDWMDWPQAKKPFTQRECAYIETLSAEDDISVLNTWGWKMPSPNRRVFRTATMVLKWGAKKGLSPFKIGRIMSRSSEARALDMESEIEASFKFARFTKEVYPADISDDDDDFIKDMTERVRNYEIYMYISSK